MSDERAHRTSKFAGATPARLESIIRTHEWAYDALIAQIKSVLGAIQRSPGCWCEHGIGNPNAKQHSPACERVRSFLSVE